MMKKTCTFGASFDKCTNEATVVLLWQYKWKDGKDDKYNVSLYCERHGKRLHAYYKRYWSTPSEICTIEEYELRKKEGRL